MFGGSASEKFEKSLHQTCENSEIMLSRRQKKHFELFGVIQGESESQKRKWFEKLSKVGEFDGWALSPKPSTDLFQIASHLILAEELGLKNLHVLQIGNVSGMMTIKYFSKMSKGDMITFDSSTAIRYGSHLRRMIISLFGNVTLKMSDNFNGDPQCSCPVCKDVGIEMYRSNSKGLRALAMHNLWVILQTSNNLDLILENDTEEFYKIRQSKMRPVYDFMEMGFDKGLDKAVDKFKAKLEVSSHIHQKQTGIFSFAGEVDGN
jgi:tRNA-guanine family transglycosylase